MHLTLLGTGCPVACPERAGAATLVQAGGTTLLFDCGSMVTQRLVAAGTSGAAVDALIVTHLHSDHLVDFYQLLVSGWHQGRDRPLRVFCPAPVEPVIRATLDAWAGERSLRIAFERRPSATGLEVEIEHLSAGRPLRFGQIEVEPVEVDHAPVVPAFGFVCRAAGRIAVLSGDTRRSAPLIEAGRGADLLVHEVFLHREMGPVPGRRDPQTIAAVASYHTPSDQVGGVAHDMQARALALTHFVPPAFDRAALLDEVAQSYPGPVFVGEDLMRFELDSGQVALGRFRARLL